MTASTPDEPAGPDLLERLRKSFEGLAAAQVVQADMPAPDAEDNPDAARILGKRHEDVTGSVLVVNMPCEEGFHCPVCVYPAVVDGEFDERLAWSEYRTMLWCHECERDYPSALCIVGDPSRATQVYLSSVKQVVAARSAVVGSAESAGATSMTDPYSTTDEHHHIVRRVGRGECTAAQAVARMRLAHDYDMQAELDYVRAELRHRCRENGRMSHTIGQERNNFDAYRSQTRHLESRRDLAAECRQLRLETDRLDAAQEAMTHQHDALYSRVADLADDLQDLLQTYAWANQDGTWLGYAEFVAGKLREALGESPKLSEATP